MRLKVRIFPEGWKRRGQRVREKKWGRKERERKGEMEEEIEGFCGCEGIARMDSGERGGANLVGSNKRWSGEGSETEIEIGIEKEKERGKAGEHKMGNGNGEMQQLGWSCH